MPTATPLFDREHVHPGLVEAELEDRLAAHLEASGLWHVYRQVTGRALWAPCSRAGVMRADVVAVAAAQGLEAGWGAGAIVFEIKCPDRAPGPGLCQVMDYLSCTFRLPAEEILPAFGFLFPAEKVHGPLASVLCQNRAGTARLDRRRLTCWCGEQRVVTIGKDGTLDVGTTNLGEKFGSRR